MTDEPDAEDLVVIATVKLLALLGYPPGRQWPAGVADQLREVRQSIEHATAQDLAIAEAHIERGNEATMQAWRHVRSLLSVLRPILEKLPAECRYHGARLDPPDGLIRREACCDTGVAALRRRNAQRVVDHIDAEHTSKGRDQR